MGKRELQSLARQHAEAAVLVLVRIMNDEAASDMARIEAAREILDRAFGKPTVTISQEIDGAKLIEDDSAFDAFTGKQPDLPGRRH